MQKISPKVWALLLAGIGVAAMLFLATGLSSVDLMNKTNYALPTENPGNPAVLVHSPNLADFIAKLGIIFSLIVPVSILYIILSREGRKRFVIIMIPISLMLLGLWYITRNINNSNNSLDTTPAAVGTQAPLGSLKQDYTTIPPFSPSNSPNWLIYVVSLGVVGLLILAGIWTWRVRQKRVRLQPLEQLINTAQDALDDIRAGGDLKDVILRCYQEMNVIASEKKAVVRPGYLTPRAFTSKLEAAGLPGEQVSRLTRLFEAVRYGGWNPGPKDEREAIVCLEMVIDTLRTES